MAGVGAAPLSSVYNTWTLPPRFFRGLRQVGSLLSQVHSPMLVLQAGTESLIGGVQMQ